MQYKPKFLSGSDRRSREVDLPADLELLGEQLTDDAAFLAKAFPASPVKSQSTRSVRFLLPSTIAAAVVLFAAGVWSIGLWGDWASQPASPTSAVVSTPSNGASTSPAVLTEVTNNPTEADVEAAPAIWFYELNAPEQEALLDWWEQEGSGNCELSF